jgi:gliding motility-associated lipoprotein GldK
MKKIVTIIGLLAIFSSCGNYNSGELVGVSNRGQYFEPEPFGMVFVPQGSFKMGPVEEDITHAQNSMVQTVSLDAYWMDETEITNNEYRQFVYWVRDSIMRRLLAEQLDDYAITEGAGGEIFDPPHLNWEMPIDREDEEVRQILKEMYYQGDEKFWGRQQIDTRKLNYEYFWVDYKQAARKSNRYNHDKQEYEGFIVNNKGEKVKIESRADFIIRDNVNVYPDTLCWIADFTYSYNEPWTKTYFWHPAYDNYPVVGVSWKQANAFCVWRTNLLNNALRAKGGTYVHDYRLPLEAEWEYAARGGLQRAKYPWGGPYARNIQGCVLANFKPLRGNYTDDGGSHTTPVGTYSPNEYGLYDMAGNVAEWTASAYDESSYSYTHDLNPDYKYQSRPDDPRVLKRKIIRGGSWKDVALYLQCGTRTFEYQDSTKSFIGFRCVRSYLGNRN